MASETSSTNEATAKEAIGNKAGFLSPPATPSKTLTATEESEKSIFERRKKSFEYTKSVLLGKVIKVTLSDGRTLTGKFICIDRLKNLILTDVTEERYIDPQDYRYRLSDSDGGEENDKDDNSGGDNSKERLMRVERHISQAMIPGKRLIKAEISQSLLEGRNKSPCSGKGTQ